MSYAITIRSSFSDFFFARSESFSFMMSTFKSGLLPNFCANLSNAVKNKLGAGNSWYSTFIVLPSNALTADSPPFIMSLIRDLSIIESLFKSLK